MEPNWTDGEPTNLTAAALDAIEWLRVLQKVMPTILVRPEQATVLRDGVERLERCIACLEREATRKEAAQWAQQSRAQDALEMADWNAHNQEDE